ncbi:MAG: hypothetical protein HYT80_03880 [Euryarchaeota archaeon]|nr:hypothetical protein [Euryarchaeota archaeon]
MASLRDVLNHAGKKVLVQTGAGAAREGLAMRRGDVGLLEPKLSPRAGDRLEFADTGERFEIVEATEERNLDKVDHFRCRLGPVRG